MKLLLAVMTVAAMSAAPRVPAHPVRRLPLAKRIELLLSTKEAKTARWGIHVVDAATKKTIFEWNADEHFTPASNTKLFSSAMAMERLGSSYRFQTSVRVDRPIDGAGSVDCDLRLVGGADPSLSGRAYPYRKLQQGEEPGDPLEPIAALADQVIKAGVKVITGDIVGDDRLFLQEPYPEGWTLDDSLWDYGAPVSALPFNDGAFLLSVTAGEQAGDPAVVMTNPPSLPVVIDNRAVTVESGETKVTFDRPIGSRQVRVLGRIAIGSRAVKEVMAVDDEALYAANALYDVLTRRGVLIHGRPASLHRYSLDEPFDSAEGIELARRESPPLVELAQVLNKVSQNLHAELLMRETARVRAQQPTREAGLKEMTAFLEQVGIPEEAYHFEDGSGLSRRTLLSPRAITKLLEYMDSTVHRDEWEKMLPIGGEDGTLQRRFDRVGDARAIHAKTGTLATTNALSGYITTAKGKRLIFSVIANNFTAKPSEIRRVIDRIGLALVAWEGI